MFQKEHINDLSSNRYSIESRIYISTHENIYFNKNIFGEFTLNMENTLSHYITLPYKLTADSEVRLHTFLSLLMPPQQIDESFRGELEIYVYKSFSLGGIEFSYVDNIVYNEKILPILRSSPYPLIFKFEVAEGFDFAAKRLLRYAYDTAGTVSKEDYLNDFLRKCV